MFCHACGHELPDAAQFCSRCGTALEGPARPEPTREDPHGSSSDEPVVVLQPVFVARNSLVTTIPLTLFFTVWAGGFFGGFSQLFADGLGLPGWLPFVFFGGLAFFGLPGLVYHFQRRTYARTRYRFYRDRLEYYEGFFTVEEKTIPLANVTEVNLRKGVLQEKHGLGTIVLSTPASVGGARSGIRIADVPDPDGVYRNVTRLIEAARTGGRSRRAA